MTTVLRAADGSGSCNAACYDAAATDVDACTCVCDGRNHGRGFDAAVRNAPRLEARSRRGRGTRVTAPPIQEPLWRQDRSPS